MALTNKMNTKHQFNLEQDFFLFQLINYNSLILRNALLTQKHILRQIAWGPWGVHHYLTLSDLGGSGGEERAEIV